MVIKRSKEAKDRNIWGKKCNCGGFAYDFFNEHLFSEEIDKKEVICSSCMKKIIVTIEEARDFYNELIYDCFKDVKGNVLEIGCGGGLLTTYLTNKKDIKSTVALDNDMEEEEINYINSLDNCEFVKINLNDFDERAFNNFDYVVCKDVLMYLDNIEYTFSKLSKISDKVILLNWYNENHKNCVNKTYPNDVLNIIKKYYKNIEISYPSFYKWGYLIKTRAQ